MPSPSPEYLRTHEIVRAGAGAGKTYTLTHKVMDIADEFLARSGRLPRLIVTTFTRKATQELRERLMVLALEEKPHLVDFVNSKSNLVVSTIHGVMDLYLKRYGGNICIDPSYTVIGAAEAGKMARQTLRQVLLADPKYSELLEQYPFNRLVSIARRLDTLMSEHPDTGPFTREDFERLFENKSWAVARSLEDSARKIKEESVKTDWLAMADDYIRLADLLKKGEWTRHRDSFFAILDGMKTARKNAKSPPVTDTTADEAEKARESAKEFREPVYDPVAWDLFTDLYGTLRDLGLEFSEKFRNEKTRQGWLEISDLELQAMRCIRNHPQTVEAFWREWDYWLIDEYQDTSPFQVELLRNLAGESPCFIVGDPQQSIYLFRGARSEVFGEKESEILEGGGEQRLLTVNRRSNPELLLFLNDFFSKFDPPFKPMEPFFKDGVSLDPAKVVAKIYIGSEAEKGDDDSKNAAEMRSIVSHVQELLSSGAAPEDVCVLARTNRTLSEVASWLSRHQIPTHVHAAAGFFDRRETRDALSILKFLVNPHDNLNTVELLRSPWFRMPDRSLVEITLRKPESLWTALLNERSSSDEFHVVSRLQRLLQCTLEFGLTETFKTALIESGFIDMSLEHDISGRRESNIWKLISRLEQEECRAGFNPLQFISGSVSEFKIDEGNAEGDAVAAVEPARVNLMTIHASKGLEFKHVILPRMEQRPRVTTNEEFTFDEVERKWAVRVPFGENRDMTGSLPERLWLERFQRQELEENARVLYVALTRAVESIYLSWTSPVNRHSWADMVRLDLEPGLHDTPNYSYEVSVGEKEVRQIDFIREERLTPRRKWSERDGETEASVASARAGKPASVSVTQILDRKAGIHFVSGAKPDVVRRLKVASQGTAVHRLMEILKYKPSKARLEMLIKKWFPRQEEKVRQAVEYVGNLSRPPLMEIIENGFVEYGFSFIEDGALIEGQIDLWGRTRSGEAWIVDYKTGNVEYRDKAFDQMALYALALRKSGLLNEGESLRLAAVYPFSEEVYVAPEPSAERVREIFGLKVNKQPET